MRKYYLLFYILFYVFCINILYAQTYCAGDQISTAHQNISHEVCAEFEDYPTGSEFKLADYNGELNGGNYHIIFIDISASW